jgi:DNA-directed RNA polymerase subunit RPC12/RpoP
MQARPNEKGLLGATQKAFFEIVCFRGRIISIKQESCQKKTATENKFLVLFISVLSVDREVACPGCGSKGRTEYFTRRWRGRKEGQGFVPGLEFPASRPIKSLDGDRLVQSF